MICFYLIIFCLANFSAQKFAFYYAIKKTTFRNNRHKILMNTLWDTQEKHHTLIAENKHRQLEELTTPAPDQE